MKVGIGRLTGISHEPSLTLYVQIHRIKSCLNLCEVSLDSSLKSSLWSLSVW